MGKVFRARDTRLGRMVAIKVLHGELSSNPDRLARFEQEARTASALNHPNIVIIYEIGQVDSQPYMVMEYVEGKTLRDVLGAGALSIRKILRYAVQLANGLAKAHEAGIVHRDLKPENLMVNEEGLLKILDFGVAKLVQPEVSNESTTMATTLGADTGVGAIVGTVGYMSPEQAASQPVDFRADHFSVGTILYEMATAQRAFYRNTSVETLSAIIRDDPEPIASLTPDFPAPLRWVIERCLAKEPKERYGCTADLARELQGLERLQHELGAKAISEARAEMNFWSSRSIAIMAASVLVLTAIAGVGIWKYLATREHPWPQFTQLTFRRGAMSRARFAPDGDTVVYAAAWEGKPLELFTTRIGSPESRPLGISNADIMAISRSGELAIGLGCTWNWGECHDATLARMPLAGGAPRQILEHVDSADWSPDGRELVVVSLAEGQYRLQYPIGKTLYEAPGWITHIRMSPTGDRIAFMNHPVLSEVSGSVEVVDLEGKRKVLSSGWKSVFGLAWEPSGKEVWFTGSQSGQGPGAAVYAVDLNGHLRVVAKPLQDGKLFDISPNHRILLSHIDPRALIIGSFGGSTVQQNLSWFDYSTSADLSNNGKTLLFYEWGLGAGGTPTAYIRGTDGSDPIRLGEGRPLALSPDGKWVIAMKAGNSGQLILLPTGAGQQKRLPQGDIEEFYSATWFPDGVHILLNAAEKDRQQRSYTQDITGGPPKAITAEASVIALLSPDARAYAKYNIGGYSLCPMQIDAECRSVPGLLDNDTLLRWSADGRYLYVRGAGDLVLDVFRINLATGNRERWKRLSPPDPTGVIAVGGDPGQVLLTPDGNNYVYTYWSALSDLFVADGLQ
jgi:Tol biopolymer transport system component